MTSISVQYGEYCITTDKGRMQPENIHRWLSTESYWSKGIPFDVVKTAIDNSFCIGVLSQNVQIGFARLVTDYATFAYLADVYVVDEHRGQGLSKKMMELIMSLPWMGTLRRICLATVDAHGLYTKFGFQSPAKPDRLLEITRPMIYGDNSNI